MKDIKKIILMIWAMAQGLSGQCPIDNTKTYPQVGDIICNNDESNAPCKFDWVKENWEAAYLNVNTNYIRTEIKNPYFATSNTNTYNFALYENPLLKDMSQEEGWELIKKEFGMPFSSEANAKPYAAIIFYNKYRSILRVFVYLAQKSTSYNGASIVLKFRDNDDGDVQTALLTHYEPVCNALDFFKKKINQSVPNHLPDAVPYWLHADFIMAYDPCTCFADELARSLNQPIQLEITPKLIQTSNLKFTINGTSTEQIANNAGVDATSSSQASNGFFDNLTPKNVSTAVQNGVKIYKTAGSAISTFESMINKSKGEVQWKTFENTAAYNEWRDYHGWLINEPQDLQYNNGDGTVKVNVGTVSVQNLFKVPNFLKKSIPYAGAALGIVEFFVNGGQSQETVPPKPSVYYLDLKGEGTITYETDGLPTYCALPGTNVSQITPSLRPQYNNVLGIFTLLETPKVQKVTYVDAHNILKPYNNHNGDYLLCNGATTPVGSITQFTLENPISYALNPASGLELVDLQAALIFNAPRDLKYDFAYFGMPYADLNAQSEVAVARNMSKCFVEPHSGITGNITQYRSEFMSLNNLQKLSFLLVNGSGVDFKIMVKAILQRKDNPNLPNVTFISTYKTNMVDLGDNWDNTGKKNATSILYNSDTDKRLSFGYTYDYSGNIDCSTYNPSWTSGTVPMDYCGCLYSGLKVFKTTGLKIPKYGINRNDLHNIVYQQDIDLQNQDLTSIGSIIIEDADVINTNTTPLHISAVQEVICTGESSSSGEIIVESRILPSTYPENINWSSRCNNSILYNPRVPTSARINTNVVYNEESSLNTELIAYPNPVNSIVNFKLSLYDESAISLYLTDMLGIKIANIATNESMDKGTHTYEYNTEGLAGGIYLYTAEINGEKYTKRLVVVK